MSTLYKALESLVVDGYRVLGRVYVDMWNDNS